jgi:hypothetical protein
MNGYNYGYGYNRYNQQGPYRSYYGFRGWNLTWEPLKFCEKTPNSVRKLL